MISHDVFVVLDVMWLAGVLKPILDHRGVTKNDMGYKVRNLIAVVALRKRCVLPPLRENEAQLTADLRHA